VNQTTRSSFRKSALASGLVTEDHIREAIAAITGSESGRDSSTIDDKRLAAKLVELNIISAYQADQLKAGRTKLKLGPYIITDWIGQGGMGQVFKAVHDMMGRESAVKVLPLTKATPDAISNFRREIRTQAKLDHPNLVRAYDAGEDGNVQYLVVEYVPGTDLRRLVRSKGKLTIQQAANIIMQTARGIEYAHQRGLVHRDIKPGNILVTPAGVAKCSDLGLAGFIHDTDDPRLGKTVGTIDYLSPEQIRTPQNITKLSDIYSLGCTLYYAVTGKVPFPGGNTRSKARRHLEETPWHPRRFNEEVSDEFVDVIADMMEKDPAMRVQSAAEVANRLSAWASDENPFVSEQMTKRSRWMPAPLPSSENNEVLVNIQETGSATYEVADLALSDLSATHGAQGSGSSIAQETRRSQDSTIPPPPPLLNEPLLPPVQVEVWGASVWLTIFISILVSLLIGTIIGFELSRLFAK
jgi:eukaryotic-like serine/threonine-protein kinase